jgi:hypothetical protein
LPLRARWPTQRHSVEEMGLKPSVPSPPDLVRDKRNFVSQFLILILVYAASTA